MKFWSSLRLSLIRLRHNDDETELFVEGNSDIDRRSVVWSTSHTIIPILNYNHDLKLKQSLRLICWPMKARRFNLVYVPDKWYDPSQPYPSRLGPLGFTESSLCLSPRDPSVLLGPNDLWPLNMYLQEILSNAILRDQDRRIYGRGAFYIGYHFEAWSCYGYGRLRQSAPCD